MQLTNMSIKIITTTLLLVLTGIVTWYISIAIVTDIQTQWVEHFIRDQAQLDKHRMMNPLIHDIALVRQLAVEPILIDAINKKPTAVTSAIQVLQRYRPNFSDRSFFFAFDSVYYFNDAENSNSGGQPIQYLLSPEKDDDRWFYEALEKNESYHVHIRAMNLWISVPIYDNDKVVGMVGTRIDISTYLLDTMKFSNEATRIQSFIINRDMKILLYREAPDYVAVTNGTHESFDLLLTERVDLAVLREWMQQITNSHDVTDSSPVTFQGHRYLLAITYLREIGWYNVMLIDTTNLFFNGFFSFPSTWTPLYLVVLFVFYHIVNIIFIKQIMSLCIDANYTFGWDIMRNMTQSLKESVEFKVAQRTKELEFTTMQLKTMNADLVLLSRTDMLTKTLNRYGITTCIQRESNYSKQTGLPCGVIMVDVDHFKNVNDRFGHSAGDTVLSTLAGILKQNLRSNDILGRWGGEEFLILLPQTNLDDSRIVAERLRIAVEQTPIRHDDATILVTISEGVNQFHPMLTTTIEECIKFADGALYIAKREGRNKVVLATTS